MPPKKSSSRGERSSFQWTAEIRLGMAEYVRSNYEAYKKALGSLKKIQFLRKLKEELNLNCNDVQLKNGFTHFMQKYNEVEAKLAQSGFGVDPDVDSTLDKGWILKQCPYYDILNEVMGTRPNLRPPYTISTCRSSPTSSSSASMEDSTDLRDPLEFENVVVMNENNYDSQIDSPPPQGVIEGSSGLNCLSTNEPAGEKKKDSIKPKTPLGMFAKIMGEKTEETVKVEREKLQMKIKQYESDRELQKEKLTLETLKTNTQLALEERRLRLDEQLIKDKQADRDHELEKLKLQQDFELKKLELQLKLQGGK